MENVPKTHYTQQDEKCIFGEHSSPRSRNMLKHIFMDKETDYIVSLVQSTSGLAFSVASLWWISKECLARFLQSLWCFLDHCPYLSSIHPHPPLGMSLTSLSARCHWKLDVWNDLFDLQLVTLKLCVTHISRAASLTGRWGHCLATFREKWDSSNNSTDGKRPSSFLDL